MGGVTGKVLVGMAAVVLAGTGAIARVPLEQDRAGQLSDQKPGSVADYLCTFAGKCGADASEGASREAPATKGFRLAAPNAAARTSAAMPAARSAVASPAASAAPVPRVARASSHPAAARPAAPAHRPPAGTRANLQLNFAYNSDQLTDAAKERARVFAAALTAPELKGQRFLIGGHTDSRGSPARNLDLSRRRAQAVADFLTGQGVAADRVEVKGYGAAQPLPHTRASAEANRRVEAVLLS